MTDRHPPTSHQNASRDSEPTIASTLLSLLRERAIDAGRFTQGMAQAIAVQAADGSQLVITNGTESELDEPLAEFSQRPWRIYHGLRVIRYGAGVDPLVVGPHDPEHEDSDYIFDSSAKPMEAHDMLRDLASAVNTIARLVERD